MNRRQVLILGAGSFAAAGLGIKFLADGNDKWKIAKCKRLLIRNASLPDRFKIRETVGWYPSYAEDMLYMRHDFAFCTPEGYDNMFGVDHFIHKDDWENDERMKDYREISRKMIGRVIQAKCGFNQIRPSKAFALEIPQISVKGRFV